MKTLLLHDSEGRVVQKNSGSLDSLIMDLDLSEYDGVFSDQDHNIDDVYIKNGEIRSKGDRPSDSYVFNYSTEQWELDLNIAKDNKWAEIKAAREAQEFGSFTWNTYAFQCDEVSQRRIQGAVQLAVLDESFSIDWTLMDNSVVTLSAQDMISVGMALSIHVNGGHVKSRALRDQIDAATSEAEIDGINW